MSMFDDGDSPIISARRKSGEMTPMGRGDHPAQILPPRLGLTPVQPRQPDTVPTVKPIQSKQSPVLPGQRAVPVPTVLTRGVSPSGATAAKGATVTPITSRIRLTA